MIGSVVHGRIVSITGLLYIIVILMHHKHQIWLTVAMVLFNLVPPHTKTHTPQHTHTHTPLAQRLPLK